MRQVQAHAEDVNLDQERRRTYLGTARVRFEALHFGRRRLRVPDEKHVEYLEGCFRTSGCRPLEKQNHISAKVSQEVLGEAIQASGIGHGDLLSNQTPGYVELEMPPGRQIECLHGQHRILAASRVLGPHDKWWAVDLYRSGTSHTTRGFTIQLTYAADLHPDLETWLTEEFVNEEHRSDGEVFRKIRQYGEEQRPSLQAKWTGRLRGKRQSNLKGLDKSADMAKAFDALRPIPGLWPGMTLTKLHKIMGLHAHEVWRPSPR